MKKPLNQLLSLLTIAVLLSGCTAPPNSYAPPTPPEHALPYKANQNYIVNCRDQCNQFEAAVRSAGGSIRQRYVNVSAISFQLNLKATSKPTILSNFPLYKDINIAAPTPVKKYQLHIDSKNPDTILSITSDQIGSVNKKSYAFNNQLTGALKAHQNNISGKDIIVAVIDSGTANNAETVPTLTGSVIGGENLIPFDPDINEPSATSTKNDEHGTWVGTMIAGHASLIIDKTKNLAQAVMRHAPESINSISETEIEIPMIGSAPGAKIYALKIFSFTGGGTSSSISIAAMDRVLTLKNNFNAGLPSEPISGDGSEDNPFVFDSLNIQVLNMSLGGAALFPGQEIEDLFTDALLEAGVLVVASAGNEGFAAITGGSPATGVSSISVGAANDAIHERIMADLLLPEPLGAEFRPTEFQTIADFSSRGPTADGRNGVDLVANGVGSFAQGADGHVALVSGTSFSSPTVAGAAALLWDAHPQSTAAEIRAALIEGANPDVLPVTASTFDQGHGYLDIENSLKLLKQGILDKHLPKAPSADPDTKVAVNIQRAGAKIMSLNELEQSFRINLQPGQVKHFFVETDQLRSSLSIEVEDINPILPPAQQNTLFGDELIVSIVDAPLSFNDILVEKFVAVDKEFLIDHLQHGLVRVAVMGSWTNTGNVTAEVSLERENTVKKLAVAQGVISENESHQYAFNIDPSTTSFNLSLSWDKNWSYYPTHDLDLIIVDPDGNDFFRGATLNSPENVIFDAPQAGTWLVNVVGYALHNTQDNYQVFAVDQNGTSINTLP